MFFKKMKANDGFTLIELLVVIAVLGILAGIAVPRLSGVKDKAYLAEAQTTLGTLRMAMEMYHLEKGNYNVSNVTGITDLSNIGESGKEHELLDYVDGSSLPTRWNYKIVADENSFTIYMDGTGNPINDDVGSSINENGTVETSVNGAIDADAQNV